MGAAKRSTTGGREAARLETAPSEKLSNGASARMDVKDFIKAAELDDVLIQVVFRRSRYRMVSILHEAETKVRTLSSEDLSSLTDRFKLEESSGRRGSRTLSSKDITATLIEDELKAIFANSVKGSNGRTDSSDSRPTFPIANAVGRATLSAALGLATKVTIGAQAFMEAASETFEGDSSSSAATNTGGTSMKSKGRSTSFKSLYKAAGVDSDDENDG